MNPSLMKRPALRAVILLTAGLLQAQGPYSGGLNDPANTFDAPVPGFIGPHGEGKSRLMQHNGTYANPDNIVNPLFFGWVASVEDYSPAPGVSPDWTDLNQVLGPVTGDNFAVVSLGDLNSTQIGDGVPPGSITLAFDTPIRNLSGADFVVFENAIGGKTSLFAELAYVEVSSNGTDFARFPSVSLTPAAVGSYGYIDPRNVYGLAGKHINAYGESWGTPFDLKSLEDHPSVLNGDVNLDEIRYVRIVDIPGNGHFKDSSGQPVYDAWVTWGSGGFDLESVGIISRDMDFATWAAQQIADPDQREPNHSPRNDGIPNLFSYALGRSGTLPDAAPVSRAVQTDGDMFIEFTRDERAVDLILEIQLSTDLQNWNPIARSENGHPFEAVDDHAPLIEETSAHHIASVGVLRRVRVSAGGTAPPVHFLRLHITQTEETP
ncbi:MAG: hypothetical protein JJU05_14240 [Verrucomicrobia bacterium]|nr:hypothetical protein [Verrucomicrobiota bacterium]MCH8526597.1 hypothetical protein [Kiritimatiellia bacterium]